MPRNSDIVRAGTTAIPQAEAPPSAEQPPSQEAAQGGAFSGVLPHITGPTPIKIHNYPTFTGLFNEIGSIASVIDQINRISDFVSGRPMQPLPDIQQQPHAQAPHQHLSAEELQLRIQQLQSLQQQPTVPGACAQPVSPPARHTAQQPIPAGAPAAPTYTPAGEPAPVPRPILECEIRQPSP
ncbi:MAG: hypothetical protein O3B73_05020 [bacterium]|nr:hypothetical protein [bacterium]